MKRHLTIETDNCTGCGACAKKCPQRAIKWVVDEKGFAGPQLEEEKCVGCGLCLSTCPLLRSKSSNAVLGAFAVQLKDCDVLLDSSSGGAFTAIAKTVLEKGGFVYGCVFDDTCAAVYVRATSSEELAPMRGSKYVWADASQCYDAVRADLLSGEQVLFCALPCQVAGLKSFLGQDFPNLVTMDFLCGGPPSPAVFDAYVDTLVPRSERRKLNFKFRDKTANGTGYCISFRHNGKKRLVSRARSSYLYLFSEKILQRDSCYHCRFRGIHRDADLTIGDFWGAKAFFPDWDCKAGVSFVIVNSPKGQDLFDHAATSCQVRSARIEDIARRNIIRPDDSVKTIPVPVGRNGFFALFNSKGYRAAAWRYAMTIKRLKVLILEFVRSAKART